MKSHLNTCFTISTFKILNMTKIINNTILAYFFFFLTLIELLVIIKNMPFYRCRRWAKMAESCWHRPRWHAGIHSMHECLCPAWPQALYTDYNTKKSEKPESLSCVQLCSSMNCSPSLVCPWNSPGENTGMGCLSLLQGIFPTQVSCTAGRFFTIWATRNAL